MTGWFEFAFGIHFASASGDSSLTLLIQSRTRQQQQSRKDQSHETLACRHSGYVVSQTQLVSSDQSATVHSYTVITLPTNRHVTLSDSRLQHLSLSGRSDPDCPGSPSPVVGTFSITWTVRFGCSSPYSDLIKASELLILHPNMDSVSPSSGSGSNGSSLLYCPRDSNTSRAFVYIPHHRHNINHMKHGCLLKILYSSSSAKRTGPECFVSRTVSADKTGTHQPVKCMRRLCVM